MNITHFQANTEKNKHPWLMPGERWYRRVLLLAVAAMLLATSANIWFESNQKGEAVLVSHTENLAQIIMAQANHEARVWFINDNTAGLESLANHLQQQPAILEVSIQDAEGRSIVRAGHNLPIHEFLLSLPESMWVVPMVTTVMDRDESGAQLLGFVRITFDYARITAESRPYHRASLQQQLYLIGLAFFAGIAFAYGVLRRRRAIAVAAGGGSGSGSGSGSGGGSGSERGRGQRDNQGHLP